MGVSMKYSTMKDAFLILQPQLTEYGAFSIVSSALEQLRQYGATFGDTGSLNIISLRIQDWFVGKNQKEKANQTQSPNVNLMHVEFERLQTFTQLWPHPTSSWTCQNWYTNSSQRINFIQPHRGLQKPAFITTQGYFHHTVRAIRSWLDWIVAPVSVVSCV